MTAPASDAGEPLSDRAAEPIVRMPVAGYVVAGWLLPGLGHVLLGQVRRGLLIGIAILALFLGGIFIGGIRVIDVPGYDATGQRLMVGNTWLLQARPMAAVLAKPWYLGQFFAGPVTLVSSGLSLAAAETYPKATARLWDIGQLYTAVAGMLNLLVMIDVGARAAHRLSDNRRST